MTAHTPKRRRRRAPSALPAQPIALSSVIEPAVTGPKPEAAPGPAPTASDAPLGSGGGEQSPPPVTQTASSELGGEPKGGAVASVPAPTRRRRPSVGGHSLKLSAPLKEGEHRRWVNDDGNRIAEMKELGYEFVSETGIQTADPGSRVNRLVGTKANGEPLHAYLMATPDELYAEGEAEKEAANRQIDEAITAGRDSTGRMDEHQYGHGSIKVER